MDNDLFMYDVVFNGEIYSSYLIIKPKKNAKELTKDEISQSAAIIFTGAMTTVDMLNGVKLDEDKEKLARKILEVPEVSEKTSVLN